MPARSRAKKPSNPFVLSTGKIIVWMVFFPLAVIGLVVLANTPATSSSATVNGIGNTVTVEPIVPTTTEPIFALPREHTSEQYDNFLLTLQFMEDCQGFGLIGMGFPCFDFSPYQRALFEALGFTESSYLNDQVSIEAGCVGLFQGCNLTVCPQVLWDQTKTNIWCGAKLFRELLDTFPDDQDRVIASYKGAFLMEDTNGDGIKDARVLGDDGLPIIDESLRDQVDSVKPFIVWVPTGS